MPLITKYNMKDESVENNAKHAFFPLLFPFVGLGGVLEIFFILV